MSFSQATLRRQLDAIKRPPIRRGVIRMIKCHIYILVLVCLASHTLSNAICVWRNSNLKNYRLHIFQRRQCQITFLIKLFSTADCYLGRYECFVNFSGLCSVCISMYSVSVAAVATIIQLNCTNVFSVFNFSATKNWYTLKIFPFASNIQMN